MLKILLQRFRNNAPTFGLISVIGGFVTDVLQPIAPFSSYIFYAATVAALFIFLTFLFKSALREKLSNSLLLALSIMIVTGSISLLQKYSDNDKKGVLANNFKIFEKFQNQLGIIETQILEIKDISIENLEETKKLSELIEKSKKELEKKIDEISPQNELDQSKMKILKYLRNFDSEELASAIDQAIAEAVSEGISEAEAQAGIKTLLVILANGGSVQEAWDAGCAAAGQDPGC